MSKKILVLLFGALLLAGMYGVFLYNKPVQSLRNVEPFVEIGSNELLEAFEADEAAANDKFLDKVLLVNGVIDKIEESEGRVNIFLKTKNPLSSITCELEQTDLLDQYKSGDPISVKGLCSGYLMDVVLIKSVIN
jgi:hypothetical protein